MVPEAIYSGQLLRCVWTKLSELRGGFAVQTNVICFGQVEKALPVVHELIRQRALVAESDLLSHPIEPETRTPIEWLTMPTVGPPHLLERSMRSYVADIQQYEKSPRLFVSDDSLGSEEQGQNLHACRSLIEQNTRLQIYYAGKSEKYEFARRLMEKHDIPPDVIMFALLGCDGFERAPAPIEMQFFFSHWTPWW